MDLTCIFFIYANKSLTKKGLLKKDTDLFILVKLDKSNSRLQLPFHTSYLSYDVFSLDSCSFLQFFRYLSLLSLLKSFYDPNVIRHHV